MQIPKITTVRQAALYYIKEQPNELTTQPPFHNKIKIIKAQKRVEWQTESDRATIKNIMVRNINIHHQSPIKCLAQC